MQSLIRRVKETIRKWSMLSGGETVVAAVSGGADSVVMLHLLWSLKDELSLGIIAAHLDHGLRDRESRGDYLFVEALAARLGLPFEGGRLEKGELKAMGGSPQEAARKKRYEFLDAVADRHGAKGVALGHTLDDQAETVLMRLVKGSSLAGLTGIPPKRGRYFRPILYIKREEVEDYVGREGLLYVTDSTNLEKKYLRNRIRLDLMPALRRDYNPNITETIARTADILAQDDEYIEVAAGRAFRAAAVESSVKTVCLDRKKLIRLHRAVLSRVFLASARSLGGDPGLLSRHVESFTALVKGRKPNALAAMPGGVRAERAYDRVFVTTEARGAAPAFGAAIKVPGRTVIEGAGEIEAAIVRPPRRFGGGKAAAWFDYDSLRKAGGQLFARQSRPGDRMAPFGMTGRRKLKDIFIDEKMPPAQRRRTPVVLAGEAIIWVAGVRQSNDFKVVRGTKMALRLDFTGA